MNSKQKDRIILLRKEGLGYKRIATELGISVNTVKSFCQRQGLMAQANQDKPLVKCPVCDKTWESRQGNQKKRFCSDSCRSSWWNTHKGQMNRASQLTITCSYCKKHFRAYRKEQRKFCSHNCYILQRFW